MSAGKAYFTLEQGVDCPVVVTWYTDETETTPVDLTNYTARMQARLTHADTATLFDITSGASEITLGGTAGTIAFPGLTATLTAAMTFDTGVYDLEVIDSGGLVTRLIQGDIVLTKETTR